MGGVDPNAFASTRRMGRLIIYVRKLERRRVCGEWRGQHSRISAYRTSIMVVRKDKGGGSDEDSCGTGREWAGVKVVHKLIFLVHY